VVALGDVRGPSGGLSVGRGGGRQVAPELVEVAADGVPAMLLAEHLAQPVGLAQPSVGSQDVADRNSAPEHRGGVMVHRVVGEGGEVVVPSEDLRPFVSRVVDLFGTQRLMFGSDWPVCLLAVSSYQEVVAALEEALGDLSEDESRLVYGANAGRFYGLTLPQQ
jgi:L-fuconolactonase